MNKKKRIIVCAVAILLLIATVVGIIVALVPQKEQGIPETSESTKDTDTFGDTAENTESTDVTDGEETVNRDDYVFDDGRETAAATPIITFDDGNEIYMDMDVAEKLEAMEKAEGDARVNKILDTIIQLINKFEDKGYSSKAIKQIQRFYFICHDELMQKDHDTVENKIEQLIPASGAYSDSFAERAYDLLGTALATDYSYIFEVSQ